MNPVASRELRERFRTLRSPILLSVWVLAAGGLTFLAYVYAQSAAENRLEGMGQVGLGSVVAAGSMGAFILHALLLGLLTAVVFVVPGQAAVAIVGERERQTLPLLQVSQLTASRIVIGKLVASLAFILLLLVVIAPLLSIPMLLGGVRIGEIVGGILMVGVTAVTIGALSMWISSRSKSMQGAVLGSYVMAAALVFGTLALTVGEVLLIDDGDGGRTRYERGVARDDGREIYSTWMNPYLGLVDASTDILEFGGEMIESPYQPFRQVLIKRQGYAASSGNGLYGSATGEVFMDRQAVMNVRFQGGDMAMMQRGAGEVWRADPIRGAIWWRTLLFQVAISSLALWAAAHRIKAPATKIRRGRRREPANAS